MKVNVYAGLKEVWGHSISHSLTVPTITGSEIDKKIHWVTVKGNVQKLEDNNSEKLGVIQPDQFSHFSCSFMSNSATPSTAACQDSLSITNSHSLYTLMSRVGDAIQPSHPLSFPSPPALNLSQHQGLFIWVTSSHQVAKVWEFQLHHQSFLKFRIFRTDFLQDGLVGCPCSPKDSQESSSTPQFRSISSLVFSFLHGATLTSIHDYWKNRSLD